MSHSLEEYISRHLVRIAWYTPVFALHNYGTVSLLPLSPIGIFYCLSRLTPPDYIKARLPDWKNQLSSYRKNIIGILFLVLVGLLIGVMIKDGKGQPAQPSNKEKVDDNGYNGQCFINGTCSDGHLLRATNAETLKV